MTTALAPPSLSYPVLSEGARRELAFAVFEPNPAAPPVPRLLGSGHRTRHRRHAARTLSRTSRLARAPAPQAGPEGQEAAPRAVRRPPHLRALSLRCAAAETAQDGGAGRRRARLGPATAPLRPGPDGRAPRGLCRSGRPPAREAGCWDVDSRAKGLAIAPRSRSGPRPGQPDRRQPRIHPWMPGIQRRASACRCPRTIHIEMLASTGGCRHLVADAAVAVQL